MHSDFGEWRFDFELRAIGTAILDFQAGCTRSIDAVCSGQHRLGSNDDASADVAVTEPAGTDDTDEVGIGGILSFAADDGL